MKIELDRKLLNQIKNSAAGRIPRALSQASKTLGNTVHKAVDKTLTPGVSPNAAKMQADLQKRQREQKAQAWARSQRKK